MRELIIEVPDRFGQELKPYKVNSEIKGELIRCKDCQYWRNDQTATKWLPCSIMQTDKNWFCADGEKEGQAVKLK